MGADVAGELVDLVHALLDGVVHLLHFGTWMGAVAVQGIGQRDGDIGALVFGQAVGGGVEIDVCHGVGTIDALAHLDGVEIDLHDAFLAPDFLNQKGEISLQALTQPRPVLPQEDVVL